MKYVHINKYEEFGKPIVVKVSAKLLKIISKMATLAEKHAELDRLMINEFAKINNISEDEASDIMCFNDFMVDISQYGGGLLLSEISLDEYKRLKDGNNE